MPQGGGGLVDLKEQQVGVQHLLHQCVLSVVHHQLLLHGQEEEEKNKTDGKIFFLFKSKAYKHGSLTKS